MKMVRLLVTLVLATCLVLYSGSANVIAASYSPAQGVLFNNPYGSASEKRRIIAHIISSINNTPRNGIIRFAVFTISDDNFATALINAKNRGVKVKIIINDPSRSERPMHASAQRLIDNLGTNRSASSYITWCKGACMSADPETIMHSKLYLFSNVGTQKYISMTGSSNPSIHNIYGSWNDLYTITNNASIYSANLKYFNDLLRETDNPNYFWSYRAGKFRTYYFPKNRNSQNFYETVLSKVRCSGVTKGYGYQGRTVIRVNMYFWGNDMLSVAQRLRYLDSQGCEVQIILNNTEYHLGSKILPELLKPSRTYGVISVYDTASHPNKTHAKYLTINGYFDGNSAKKIVYTGSANWTHNSQSEDNDNVIRIDDETALGKYNAHFRLIRDRYANPVR